MPEVAPVSATSNEIDLVEGPTSARTAFDAVYREHYRRLVSALRLGGAGREEAEDIAQEAFIRTFARWSRVSRGTNPPGYVYRVAFRLQRSRLRRVALLTQPFGRDPGVDGHEDQVVTSDVMQVALETLSPQQRRVAALCVYVEMSPTEAASVLKLRAGAVRVQLHEAQRRLQTVVEQ